MKRLLDGIITLLIGSFIACADGALESPETQSDPTGLSATGPKGDDVVDSDCPDTVALPDQNPPGLNAMTRITSMRIPTSRNQAMEYGCDLVAGTTGGIGLSALTSAMQLDINELVSPGPEGLIQSVILGHVEGWSPGQTSHDTESLSFRLYSGVQRGGGEYSVDPISFLNDGQPRVAWPAHVGCGRLETEPGPLAFDLSAETSGLGASLNLTSARVSSQIVVNEAGLSFVEGTIVGYLPESVIISIVQEIKESCQSPNAPDLCVQANSFLAGDAVTITRSIVLPFLHGLDAHIGPDGQQVNSCSGDECNALSICVRIEGESVSVVQ